MVLKLKSLKKMDVETITLTLPKVGDIVQGKIIAKEKGSVYLDLGYIGTGIIYGKEFYDAQDILKKMNLNDEISAKLINLENEEGYRELSIIDASKEAVWRELANLKQEEKILEVKIKKALKNGLAVEVKGILGFLPLSQLKPEHYSTEKDKDNIIQNLQKFINETFKVKILDLDPKRERLILSEKTVESKKGAKKQEIKKEKERLKKYKIGDIIQGKITGITNFGAFVNFGEDIEGLLYSFEISEKEKPEETLKLGQEIKAKIIKIENDQIYLSLKQL